jgi:hypothetical protein
VDLPSVIPFEERPSSSSSSVSSSTTSSSSSLIFKSLAPGQDAALNSKFAIEETLDQLIRLTAFIRKSSIRNRYLKAASFIETERVKSVEEFKTGVVSLINFRHPQASQQLRDRLVETVSLRQRQLSYSKQRKDWGSSTDVTVSLRQAAPTTPIPGDQSLPLDTANPTKSELMAGRAQKPENLHSGTFTQRSASVIDRHLLPKTFSAKASSIGSGIRNNSGELWLPSPPKNLRHGAKEFECPICFIYQPIEKAIGENWK